MTTATSKTTTDALLDIAPKVDSVLLIRTALELGVHHSTISRYLRGEVPGSKMIFADKLLTYLKSQISCNEGR